MKTVVKSPTPLPEKTGLTVTSANHVANIAKEMYEAAESRLGSLKLYSRDYLLAVTATPTGWRTSLRRMSCRSCRPC